MKKQRYSVCINIIGRDNLDNSDNIGNRLFNQVVTSVDDYDLLLQDIYRAIKLHLVVERSTKIIDI